MTAEIATAEDVAVRPATGPLNGERLYSFASIAAKLPGHRGNAHINASTIYRWVVKGVRAPNGEVIRLEATRLGAAWKTSLESVARFSERLTAASLPGTEPATEPTPTLKQQRGAAALASKKADAIFGGPKK